MLGICLKSKGFFVFKGGNQMWFHLVVQTCNSTFFIALMSHDLYKMFFCH